MQGQTERGLILDDPRLQEHLAAVVQLIGDGQADRNEALVALRLDEDGCWSAVFRLSPPAGPDVRNASVTEPVSDETGSFRRGGDE